MNAAQTSSTGETAGTIIHIGAGRCRELPEYLAQNPERILLIEPNPRRAQELARRTAEHEHVEVRAVAVTDDPSRTRLQLFNLADLSSLRAPTGAYELFPGLKATGEVDVDTITPAELFKTGQCDADDNHRLIIDAPGEETAIVNAVSAADQLAHFDHIIIHCGTESLYEDNAPAATLLDQLREAGYDIEQQDDSDPDRPCWSLRHNPLRPENQALRQQVAELEQQTKELTASRDERVREAEERKQAHEALHQEKEGLEEKVANLEKQLDEASTREQVLREQVTRAEGQIELVKDLVIDGPAL
jgi:FkbM family methyltransferase